MWHHIDFTFTHTPLNPKEQVMFEHCLVRLIVDLRLYIKRKFYLYEPNPHCFLAIELHDVTAIEKIKKLTAAMPDFIQEVKFNPNDTQDEANGEDFLIILDAFTEAYLFHRKTRLSHIIHCALEFQFQTRDKEINFLNKQLALYGGEEYR